MGPISPSIDLINYVDPKFIKGLLVKALNERTTIEYSALQHCHTKHLHSFIISMNPKVRLFIADSFCDLQRLFNPFNPVIPIHPHKHIDVFCNLEGQLIHHLYSVGGTIPFDKCHYYRLTDAQKKTTIVGKEGLAYLGPTTKPVLHPRELHTVSCIPGPKGTCAWTVTEFDTDEDFRPIGYGKDISNIEGLYQKFQDPCSYIKNNIRY